MKIVVYSITFFILIQFIPITKDNPQFSKDSEIITSKKVKAILKKACYDCHSNEVKYSIYSYIAPMSWSIRSHIKHGRMALNFSTWKEMNPKYRDKRIDKMKSQIDKNLMPLSSYLLFHEEALLSADDRSILSEWIDGDLQKYRSSKINK